MPQEADRKKKKRGEEEVTWGELPRENLYLSFLSFFLNLILFFILAMLRGLRDLSSPTRD